MIIDNTIKEFIDQDLVALNIAERADRELNSRLTAGFLWQPKRFQLLKYLNIAPKQPDTYALRKFKRGRDVEAHLVAEVAKLGALVESQKELTYRGVYGLADMIVDQSDGFNFRCGVIPHEVKSVTGRAYKWIVDKGEISWHYKMQAGFYGLAMNTQYFGLDFIASDDLREHCTIHKTREVKADVDKIIDEYEQMIKDWNDHKIVPAWQAHDKWMENPDYMPYDPAWATATDQEFVKRIKDMSAEKFDSILKG